VWWLLGAVVGPVATAAACIPFRSTAAQANLALVLVVTVVLAASGGRRLPGAVAAVSAGLGFDFFLTRPYYSLSITSHEDIVTLVVLVVVGLLVGEISSRTRRARSLAAARAGYLARLEEMGQEATHSSSTRMAHLITRELLELLPIASCRYESDPDGHRRLPTLEPDGTVLLPTGTWSVLEQGFPREVIEIPTHGSGGGRLVLVPMSGIAVDPERLRLALALVDRFRSTPASSTF